MTRLAAPIAQPTTDVIIPESQEEAVEAFGDGVGITIFAGGTIVMPLITYGHAHPQRVLMLHAAGMNGVADGTTLTIGSTVTLAELAAIAPEPLASAARIADREIRAQGTVGGNLCAGGDLQPALIALGARVRSAGTGGERIETVEEFLERSDRRLVLSVDVERPRAGAFLAQRRRHAHTFTVLSVAVVRTLEGIRVAVGGAGEHALRCPSVERALAGGSTARLAAETVVEDVQPRDDALASAWYRKRVLPVLVARALEKLEETK